MVFSTSFLAFIQGLKLFSFRIRRDDDFCDRLSHHITALILLITSILISSNQYVGNPIHCWVPKEFSDQWQKYTNNYCWIKNTYVSPPSLEWTVPKHDERAKLEINYYQWVPIVLLIQSLLFYLPSIVWRILNWFIGVNVQEIISKAMDVYSNIENKKPEPKSDGVLDKILKEIEKYKKDDETKNDDESLKKVEKNEEKDDDKTDKDDDEIEPIVSNSIKDIAYHLEISIESASKNKSGFLKSFCSLLVCSFGSRKYGSYLISLYFFTKLLYIINVIGQLFLLNKFIGTTYNFFGFQILNDLVKGNDWKNTGHFPRITLCDFQIRNLGHRVNYTVQCVLPINLFNEKIYIFIWFWVFIVAILTIYSLFQWILRMFSSQRVKFIKSQLKKRWENWTAKDDSLFEIFLNDRLKSDGLFLIYLVYLNAGDLVTKELLEILWFNHKQKYRDKVDQDDDDNFIDNTQFL